MAVNNSVTATFDLKPDYIGAFNLSTAVWSLDASGNGAWDGAPLDISIQFGAINDDAVTGDWNGDGVDELGLFRNGTWYLDNGNGIWNSSEDTAYQFGRWSGDLPVVGDWNGDGVDKIGLYRTEGAGYGHFFLDYDGNGIWNSSIDKDIQFGNPSTDLPVAGDWNDEDDDFDKIGIKRYTNNYWFLDTGDGSWNSGDITYTFGQPGIPVKGDWTGTGVDKIGVWVNGSWKLDTNGDGVWNSSQDTSHNFGTSADSPETGRWR